jgi:hypothetical protein
MTITIPHALKRQMDQPAEQINWPALASEAFQRKVVEIGKGRERSMVQEKVLARLKAADEADGKGFEAGRRFGRKWAEEKALPRYLRNIAKGIDYVFEDDPEWRVLPCVKLAEAITGDSSRGFQDFWNEAVGKGGDELANCEDFGRGFIAGALEVWEEVRDKL